MIKILEMYKSISFFMFQFIAFFSIFSFAYIYSPYFAFSIIETKKIPVDYEFILLILIFTIFILLTVLIFILLKSIFTIYKKEKIFEVWFEVFHYFLFIVYSLITAIQASSYLGLSDYSINFLKNDVFKYSIYSIIIGYSVQQTFYNNFLKNVTDMLTNKLVKHYESRLTYLLNLFLSSLFILFLVCALNILFEGFKVPYFLVFIIFILNLLSTLFFSLIGFDYFKTFSWKYDFKEIKYFLGEDFFKKTIPNPNHISLIIHGKINNIVPCIVILYKKENSKIKIFDIKGTKMEFNRNDFQFKANRISIDKFKIYGNIIDILILKNLLRGVKK